MASIDSTKTHGIANTAPGDLVEPSKGPGSTVEIFEGDPLYDGIKADFDNAGLIINKVERVENHHLWREFIHEQNLLQEQQDKEPDFNLNIRYLYHGTNARKEVFSEEAVDNRLSKRGCFGNGIYFSDSPQKCAKYAEKGDDEPIILISRVILGDSKVYKKGEQDRNLKREPEKPSGGRYDSVEGCPTKFKEFVIYERRRALIDCIISFSRNSDDSNEAAAVVPQTTPLEGGDTNMTNSNDSTNCTLHKGYGDASHAHHVDEDSDSCCSDEEDGGKEKNTVIDHEDTSDAESLEGKDGKDDTSDSEFEDAKEEVKEDTTSDEECRKILPFKSQYDATEVLNKTKQFMEETQEKEEILAKFFVMMENLNVEAAVNQYRTFTPDELSPEDKEEAEKAVAELQSQLNPSGRESVGLDDLDVDDDSRAVIMQELVDQFCTIVGLKKDDTQHDTMARNYLSNYNWKMEVAILAYYEEIYGIGV